MRSRRSGSSTALAASPSENQRRSRCFLSFQSRQFFADRQAGTLRRRPSATRRCPCACDSGSCRAASGRRRRERRLPPRLPAQPRRGATMLLAKLPLGMTQRFVFARRHQQHLHGSVEAPADVAVRQGCNLANGVSPEDSSAKRPDSATGLVRTTVPARKMTVLLQTLRPARRTRAFRNVCNGSIPATTLPPLCFAFRESKARPLSRPRANKKGKTPGGWTDGGGLPEQI